MKRRLTALFMVLCLLIAIVPTQALAEEDMFTLASDINQGEGCFLQIEEEGQSLYLRTTIQEDAEYCINATSPAGIVDITLYDCAGEILTTGQDSLYFSAITDECYYIQLCFNDSALTGEIDFMISRMTGPVDPDNPDIVGPDYPGGEYMYPEIYQYEELGGMIIDIYNPMIDDTMCVNITGETINISEIVFETSISYFVDETVQVYVTNMAGSSDMYVEVLKTDTPTALPEEGMIPTGEYVFLDSLNDGMYTEIYYTTNGEDPDLEGILYDGTGICITESVTIKAVAYALGRSKSDVETFNYVTYDPVIITAVPPEFTEENIMGGKQISISSPEEGATIYASLDGSSYFIYSNPLFIGESTVVYAYASKEGYDDSPVQTIDVQVEKASSPEASLTSGEYFKGEEVSFSTEFTDGAKVYYRYADDAIIDAVEYTQPIVLNDDAEFIVYAIAEGYAKSDEVKFYYTIKKSEVPTFSETDVMGGKKIEIKATEDYEKVYVSINNDTFVEYTQPINCYDYTKIMAYVASDKTKQSETETYNVEMLQTAKLIPNYASGDVFKGTAIILESYNDGLETEIYYTINDETPDKTKLKYTADGIVVTEPVTIKAVAYSMGRAVSDVVELKYTIRTAKKPTVTEANVVGGKRITLLSETVGAEIYYTLDESDPKTSETVIKYTEPFLVSKSPTYIKAYAKADKYLDSEILEYTVEIGQVAAPVFSQTNNEIYLNTPIEIASDDFATIYYTIDGTEPTTQSLLYNGAFYLENDATVKAIAVAEGWQNSIISEKAYEIYVTHTPYFVKTQVENSIRVELKSETPDALIYYTIDGKTDVYTEPFIINSDTTIKAYAVSDNRKDSEIYEETIFVRHTLNPVSNFTSGNIKTTDQIILTASPNATIYYTVDETDPKTSNTVITYTEPFTITKDTILNVYAKEEGYLDSDVITYEYKITKTINPTLSFSEDILGGKSLRAYCSMEDAKIYYTTDNSVPSASNGILYDGSIKIYGTTVVKVVAICEGCSDSDVITQEFVVPVATMRWEDVITVKTFETLGSLSEHPVYYTTDKTEPTMNSELYVPDTLTFKEDTVLKAFAIDYGYAKSAIKTYYINIERVEAEIELTYGSYYDEEETKYATLIRIIPSDIEGAYAYYQITGSQTGLIQEKTMYNSPIPMVGEIMDNDYIVVTAYPEAPGCFGEQYSLRIYTNMASWPVLSAQIPYSGNTDERSLYEEWEIREGDCVTLSSNYTIKYTTDGTDPRKSDTASVYTEPIVIDEKTTIKAYSVGSGCSDSLVKQFNIDILDAFVDIYSEDELGGKKVKVIPYYDYMGSNEVIDSTYFYGVVVYCTTDGTIPDRNSPVIYEIDSNGNVLTDKREFFVDEDVTVNAFAEVSGLNTSEIATKTIVVKKLTAPSFIPSDTNVRKNTFVTLESAQADAKIYYTLDNTTPTVNSTLYEAPIEILEDTTIKAIAVKNGMRTSDVMSVTYTIKRTQTPTHTETMTASGKIIELNCETTGSKIYYTLNGDVPTTESTLYTEPFKLKKNTVLSYVAVCEGMDDSYVVSQLIDVPYSEMSVISLGEVSAKAGQYIEVPVTIQKNPGIAAYSISVEYDNTVLTPVSAKNNWGGIFTTNIDKGENSNVDKAVSMTWLGNSNYFEDADLATVVFEVMPNAEVGTTPLYIKENGVINNIFEMVDVAYMDGDVEITDGTSVSVISDMQVLARASSTVYTDTKLKMTTEKVDEETLKVNVLVEENSGIGAYNISLLYNNELLTPSNVVNGELFDSDLMSNVTQPNAELDFLSNVTVLSCNDKDITENGLLFTVYFDIDSLIYPEHEIQFSDVQLLNVDGDKIIGTYENTVVEQAKNEIQLSVTSELNVNDNNMISGLQIQIDNNSEYTSGELIVAVFDDFSKKLVDANIMKVEFAQGVNTIEYPDVAVSSNCKTPCIGVYLWDSMTSLMPLAECKKYPVIKATN